MKTRFPKAQTAQRGYSLIELSIALAILSVIIVGSLVGVQRILANNRANNMLQSVPKVNAAIVSALANSPGEEVNTKTVVGLGAFPQELLISTTTGTGATAVTAVSDVRNEFGGRYAVTSNAKAMGNTPAKNGYFVQMNNVPQSVCATVVNGLAPMARAIYVNTDTLAAFTASGGIEAPSTGVVKAVDGATVTVASLGTQCGAAAASTITAFVPLF